MTPGSLVRCLGGMGMVDSFTKVKNVGVGNRFGELKEDSSSQSIHSTHMN